MEILLLLLLTLASSLFFCFYFSVRVTKCPGLGRVVLCSKYHVRSNDTVFLVTWAGHSKCTPCGGYVYPPVVVEHWFLLVCQWEEFTPSPIGCEKLLWPHWSRTYFNRLWCLLNLNLESVGCGGSWSVLQCGLKLSTGYVGSVTS